MKSLFLAFSFIFSIVCSSQIDTIYYTDSYMKCDKSEAFLYRLIIKQSQNYLVKDIYMNTQFPKMIAVCSEVDTLKKNGKCTFYNKNGQRESEGNFIDNVQDGIWTLWDEGVKDSTVVECFAKDSTYKNIYLPKNNSTTNNKYKVKYKIEEMPEYIGGWGNCMVFISKNIQYPQAAKEAGISGRCYVAFVIEKDGSVNDVKILRGAPGCPDCDKEALRVVKSMPNWKPGKQYGKYVRVQFNLPINFRLF